MLITRSENDEKIDEIWSLVLDIAPTDSAALDVFCERWSVSGLLKCDCGSEILVGEQGTRTRHCVDCGKTVWVTSDKLLERAKRFQAYLAAALVREAGLIISGAAFARLTGVQPSTAYNILRKFNIALVSQLPENASQISGRLMQYIIARRSRETPARMNPFSEQELIEEEIFKNIDEQNVDDAIETAPLEDADSFEENTKAVLATLTIAVGLTADQISLNTGIPIGAVTGSLFLLELDGKARSIPGGRYFLCLIAPNDGVAKESLVLSDSLKLTVNKYISVIVEYLHRVGRKGLQHYLAAIWCAFDRDRWGEGSLIALTAKHPPISYQQILNYVSPPYLKLVIC